MKLVGKKLYRIGPLKLFKNGWGSVGNRGRGAEASRGMRSSGGGSSNVYQSNKSNADRIRRQQEAQAAAAAAAAAKERERIKEEKRARAEMKGVFEKKLTGAGPQEEAREIILYESRSPVIDEIFNDLRQAIKEKENYLKENPVQVK